MITSPAVAAHFIDDVLDVPTPHAPLRFHSDFLGNPRRATVVLANHADETRKAKIGEGVAGNGQSSFRGEPPPPHVAPEIVAKLRLRAPVQLHPLEPTVADHFTAPGIGDCEQTVSPSVVVLEVAPDPVLHLQWREGRSLEGVHEERITEELQQRAGVGTSHWTQDQP